MATFLHKVQELLAVRIRGGCAPTGVAGSSRRGSSEKKLSRRKNQPFVILGSQLGRKA